VSRLLGAMPVEALSRLRPRSLDNASTGIAPSSLDTDDPDRYTSSNAVVSATTERRRVAKGDHAVITIQGTGMEGYLNSSVNFSANPNVNLTINQAGDTINANSYSVDNTSNAVEVRADPDNETYYVIIDTGPGWDSLTANALFYATEVLIPASLEAATLQGILEFQNSIERVKQYDRLFYNRSGKSFASTFEHNIELAADDYRRNQG